MNSCKYKRKKKNILKGYFWCDKNRKVYKDRGYCRCFYYQPKGLIGWIKGLLKWTL